MVHVVNLDVTQHGSLDAAVGKIEAGKISFSLLRTSPIAAVTVLDLCRWKLYGTGVSIWSESVDDWTTRIPQAQQLSNFVEGLAGGIVASMADVFVSPTLVLL